MSTNDYVKFITETFIKHFEVSKKDRKQQRIQRKEERAPFLLRWFGFLPHSLTMLFKKRS
ncbi:YqzE family protein [Bacillus chungangensis]|uniref:YqzE family protein n=1 Tax=Bacillus chungangensis TaxID=587633 RepID=A0ABT9WPF6_9BACI|nr:YqzE family protein [Bacillus chungangensis]MDQ0175163.1 hypothetical protein [Bacillus chungangensis]